LQLYLIRHAIAEAESPTGRDADRPLSSKGIERLQLEVDGLRRLGLEFDALWTSPWARAEATAKLLEPLSKTPSRLCGDLARAPRASLWKALAQSGAERLALVGHQPWLGELASLLASDSSDPLMGMRIKKGGLVWLEGEPQPGRMRLEAALPPHLLRTLGGEPVQ
jgi:phosphohistidine phosphatase